MRTKLFSNAGFSAKLHKNAQRPHFCCTICILSWKIIIIVGNVYKGFSFIVCLTVVTLMLIATFRPHTAGLHQAIVSIYWVELFVPPWLLVTGLSQTSLVVCGFRSKALSALWEEETDPSAVRCGRGRLSYCLIVGIHAIGTYGFHELKLQPFLNTPIRPGIIRSGTKLSSLTETLTGTLVELRRLST